MNYNDAMRLADRIMNDWKSIETAPKSTSYGILLSNHKTKNVGIGYYSSINECWVIRGDDFEPTRWMKIPDVQ